MKYVDEYRSGEVAARLRGEIAALLDPGRHYKLMEVCGGHTHTIYKHGVEHVLPEAVELVHGPGCPVCVIPMGRVDDAIAVAETPGVIFTSFGDMMRVPGANGNLLEAKARGADVRMVYSPLDALRIAIANPDRQVVFFAVGFETTAPSTAVTLMKAREKGITNFSLFCNHVTIIPAIRAISGIVNAAKTLARMGTSSQRTRCRRMSALLEWVLSPTPHSAASGTQLDSPNRLFRSSSG